MNFERAIDYIKNMNPEEIDLTMNALISRKREIYTDWEILYMAIPKENPKERAQTIQYIIEMLQKMQADNI